MKRNNTKSFISVILCAGMLLSGGLSHAGKSLKYPSSRVRSAEKMGILKLSHDGNHFNVKRNGARTKIENYYVDKSVRGMSQERLAKLMDHGYMSIGQLDDGQYTLKSNVRGEAGGPALGAAAYVVTKGILYGLLGAGVVGATVATGGAAAGAVGVAVGTGAAIGSIGGAVLGTAVATGAGIGGTTALVAAGTAATVGVAGGQAVVATTILAAGTAGGVSAVVVGIEAVSIAVGAAFGLAPTL